MPELIILRTLALIFVAALLAGIAARWLKQSVILGYLATGILIGPFGFNLIPDTKFLQEYANIGVALLMFAIGLEFSFHELIPVRKIALIGTNIQMGLTILLGFVLGMAIGLGWKAAVVIGCAMAISSTMVVLNTLNERGELSTIAGRVMIGMLIVQDLAVVVIGTAFPLMADNKLFSFFLPFLSLLIKTILIVFVCFAVGRWIIPFVFREVSKLYSKQLFMIAAVAVALGTAYLTYKLGLTLSLGAFLAGLMIGSSKYSHAVLGEVAPLRDIFGILFFVSIGTLLAPSVLHQHIFYLLILLAALFLGKFFISAVTALFFRYPGRVAVTVGMGLIPIGEFSFVLAQIALDLQIISHEIYTLLLAIAILSTAMTPLFFKIAVPCYDWLERLRFLPRITYIQSRKLDHVSPEEMAHHVILCGYGRVGRYIGRALKHFGKGVIVIDPYPFRIEEAHKDGLATLYGDASKSALLEKAGIKMATLLVVAEPDIVTVKLIVSEARKLRRDIPIVVRLRDVVDLEDVSLVTSIYPILAEFEGALRMVRQTLLLCRLDPRVYITRLAKQVYSEEEFEIE